jgi:hypothetical protein
MTLIEILKLANELADEGIPTAQGIGYLNGAIARINIECKSKFPYFDISRPDDNYEGFDEDWQHALLVPFVLGRIKQTDSSQFEYTDAYAEFLANLMEFKATYDVPDEYKKDSVKSHTVTDFSTHYWRWG